MIEAVVKRQGYIHKHKLGIVFGKFFGYTAEIAAALYIAESDFAQARAIASSSSTINILYIADLADFSEK